MRPPQMMDSCRPAAEGEPDLAARTAGLFAPGSVLAEQLAGYEFRQAQQRMARAVAQTLQPAADRNRLLAVEAGTGTGKTLAYLLPAALSGQRLIISTNTINLQEQILSKEVPFLRRFLLPALSVLCVKGRQNYLCLRRWRQLLATPQGRLFAPGDPCQAIDRWLEKTRTGDRAELDWLEDDDPLWAKINSNSSQCLGGNCPEAGDCFLNRLRRQAAKSQLLIVNHHLFFSDLALRRFGHAEVLPRYQGVIFDEAHHLEGIATRYFGRSLSHYQLLDLAQDLERLCASETASHRHKTIQLARALAGQAERFLAVFPQRGGRFPLAPFINANPAWSRALQELTDHLRSLGDHLLPLQAAGETWGAMTRRCDELLATLSAISQTDDPETVYWYERRPKTVVLSASPIEVASELRSCLYQEVESLVFTSATLCTNQSFRYFQERLGLDDEELTTLRIDAPFDYRRCTLLYVPDRDFPEPSRPEYPARCQERLAELIALSKGRALLLFTSIAAMRAAYQALADRVDFPLLVQGEAPRSTLLESFRADTRSVLLAVASFWEGIDVPGEALSCLVIDKLPFEVPSDPVIMARTERIRRQGGNPFFDFQVPRAILTLRQGVGRLIRSNADRGLLAILDVRLFSKGYGKQFRNSLPPSPVTRDLDEVKRFFADEAEHGARQHPA